MYELIVIGAGPGGISIAVEARNAGIATEEILVLEKAEEHSWTIRKLYPYRKSVTANYKGQEAVCHGVLCIPDLSKEETLTYLDNAIIENHLDIHYKESVTTLHQKDEGGFRITTDRSTYETKVCVIAIGIFGRPNKPDYSLPSSLKKQIYFDVTSVGLENNSVLVVGGGDSASEYVQYLNEHNNRVVLSYRRDKFERMNDVNRNSLLALEERGEVEILRSSNIVKVEDTEGKPKVTFGEAVYGVFEYIIYALGGTTPHNFLRTAGIKFDGGLPVLKPGYETSIPGLFLIGDLTARRKGGSIISAFNSSSAAMRQICQGHLACSY